MKKLLIPITVYLLLFACEEPNDDLINTQLCAELTVINPFYGDCWSVIDTGGLAYHYPLSIVTSNLLNYDTFGTALPKLFQKKDTTFYAIIDDTTMFYTLCNFWRVYPYKNYNILILEDQNCTRLEGNI